VKHDYFSLGDSDTYSVDCGWTAMVKVFVLDLFGCCGFVMEEALHFVGLF